MLEIHIFISTTIFILYTKTHFENGTIFNWNPLVLEKCFCQLFETIYLFIINTVIRNIFMNKADPNDCDANIVFVTKQSWFDPFKTADWFLSVYH